MRCQRRDMTFRKNSILIIFLTLLSFGISSHAQTKTQEPQAAGQVIERGKFHLYETKQIRGEEDYTITRTTPDELFVQAKTTLPFAEQDTKPLVQAEMRTKADYTQRAFMIKGPTLLEITENTS